MVNREPQPTLKKNNLRLLSIFGRKNATSPRLPFLGQIKMCSLPGSVAELLLVCKSSRPIENHVKMSLHLHSSRQMMPGCPATVSARLAERPP
jgi:hypothetical protein